MIELWWIHVNYSLLFISTYDMIKFLLNSSQRKTLHYIILHWFQLFVIIWNTWPLLFMYLVV